MSGKKEGQVQFISWSMFNQINHPPFEGKDKVHFEGNWKNNTRDGFGLFILPNGIKYTGHWNNGSFTGNDAFLEWQSDSIVWTKGIQFHGQVKRGIMDGAGTVKFMLPKDRFASVQGEWSEGTLQKLNEFRLTDKKTWTAKKVENEDGKWKVTLSCSDEKKKDCIWSEGVVNCAEGDEQSWHSMEMNSVLKDLKLFEGVFLKNQEVEEKYDFPSLDHIPDSRIRTVKLEL